MPETVFTTFFGKCAQTIYQIEETFLIPSDLPAFFLQIGFPHNGHQAWRLLYIEKSSGLRETLFR